MTDRKPPPMYAVWNETEGRYDHMSSTMELAQLDMAERRTWRFPSQEFRIVTLIEQPEPPQ